MIALLTACLFFEILVHVLITSAKARAKTVFGHLKYQRPQLSVRIFDTEVETFLFQLFIYLSIFATQQNSK